MRRLRSAPRTNRVRVVQQLDDRERRRSLLYAALGFCQLQDAPAIPEVTAFKQWLGTWSGLGHIVVGMERQGYAMSLRKIHDDGWAATFHQHPLLAPEGFSAAATAFFAVQQ